MTTPTPIPIPKEISSEFPIKAAKIPVDAENIIRNADTKTSWNS